jgi:outer membrane protein OmpA-like peptidoglycan-associated protein
MFSDQISDTVNPAKYINIGIRGGYNNLHHTSDFSIIPGASDCGTYDVAENHGFFCGLIAGYPLIKDFFDVNLSLFYDYRPGTFKVITSSYQVYDIIEKKYSFLEISNELSTELSYLVFEGGLSVTPSKDYPFYIRLSGDAGNPIFASKYERKQTIESPASALFPSGTKSRIINNGNLNTAGTSLGVSGALGYVHNLDNGIQLRPEISYRYGINSNVSDASWRYDILRFSIGITFDIEIQKPKIINRPVILPPVEEKKEEIPVIVEKPVIKEGKIMNFKIEPLTLTETIVTQAYPLLLYVFFDSLSTELDPKYKNNESISIFDENKLKNETIEIYHHLLDIIGNRMTINPSSQITLTGTTDGYEAPDKSERLSLALKRAQAVKNYLQERWNIDSKRIILTANELPNLKTSEVHSEGFQENRRVEITSKNLELLSPVIHSKFNEYTTNQESLPFSFNTENIDNKEYNLTIVNSQREVISSVKFDVTSETKINVGNSLIERLGNEKASNNQLTVILRMNDRDGRTVIAESPFEVDVLKNQFEIGRLNLIVFDFDKSDVSSLNQNMIINFVNSSIRKESQINITGSTDRLGDKDYNLTLSVNRANSVNNFLKSVNPQLEPVSVKGIGDTNLIYDNNLPEGRFYSRTVMIEVSTPLKK